MDHFKREGGISGLEFENIFYRIWRWIFSDTVLCEGYIEPDIEDRKLIISWIIDRRSFVDLDIL